MKEEITVWLYTKLSGMGVYIHTQYPLPDEDKREIFGLMKVYDGLKIFKRDQIPLTIWIH